MIESGICRNCRGPIRYDGSAGMWMHVGQPDRVNGLYCTADMWDAPAHLRDYAEPLVRQEDVVYHSSPGPIERMMPGRKSVEGAGAAVDGARTREATRPILSDRNILGDVAERMRYQWEDGGNFVLVPSEIRILLPLIDQLYSDHGPIDPLVVALIAIRDMPVHEAGDAGIYFAEARQIARRTLADLEAGR